MGMAVKSLKPGKVVLWAVAVGAAASVATAPFAAADPIAGGGPATDTIAQLKTEGFDVAINWLQGHPNVPLSECRVTQIHNPYSSMATMDELFTVYVDIVCPNAK